MMSGALVRLDLHVLDSTGWRQVTAEEKSALQAILRGTPLDYPSYARRIKPWAAAHGFKDWCLL